MRTPLSRPRSGGPPASGTRASVSPAPSLQPPVRRFEIPEHLMLGDLGRMLRAAGQRPPRKRTPEDHARLAASTVVHALLAFFRDYKGRVEAGANCRIVQRANAQRPGELHLEFVIEEEKP